MLNDGVKLAAAMCVFILVYLFFVFIMVFYADLP